MGRISLSQNLSKGLEILWDPVVAIKSSDIHLTQSWHGTDSDNY